MSKPATLRCAPNGARAGFLQVRVDGTTTSLTVLPKVWSGTSTARSLRAKAGTWIVAHELDHLVFDPADTATVDAFADAAERAAQDEAQRDAARRNASAPEPPGEGEDDEEEPYEDEPPTSTSQRRGKRDIEPIVRRIYGVPIVPKEPPASTDGSAESATSSLMALALLCERLRDQSAGAALDHVHADSGDGAPSTLAAGTVDNPVLSLLRAWQFVDFVKARVRQIRQGYREEEDWLWTPRGRLLTEGLLRMEASDEPRALCCYDEFTPSTALFRLIVTALERLAGASAAQGALAGTALARRVREEASRLRHALAFIPSAPAAQAVAQMRHARLGRLLRAWEPARAQAIEILERRSPELLSRDGETDASLVWSVDMSKVWERLLADAVRGITGRVAVPGPEDGLQVACPTPWKHIGDSKDPDMVTVYKHDSWVLDAKYKAPLWNKGGRPIVSAADQYQLFAYSHLTTADGMPARQLAILRPCASGGAPPRRTDPLPRNHARMTVAPTDAPVPSLTVADVPFPCADAILDEAAYDQALDVLRSAVRAVLDAPYKEEGGGLSASPSPDQVGSALGVSGPDAGSSGLAM